MTSGGPYTYCQHFRNVEVKIVNGPSFSKTIVRFDGDAHPVGLFLGRLGSDVPDRSPRAHHGRLVEFAQSCRSKAWIASTEQWV